MTVPAQFFASSSIRNLLLRFDSFVVPPPTTETRLFIAVKVECGRDHYLIEFSFNCTKSEDLWQALSKFCEEVEGPNGSSLDLMKFGTQWTKMMGYPLVTTRFSGDTVEITQQRYTLNTSFQEHEKYRSPRPSYKWDVPIWLKTHKGDTILRWVRADEPLHLNLESLQMPVVINAYRNGYYRQNYDSAGWEHIAAHFTENGSVFDQYARYVLLSDAFSAAAIGQLEYDNVFKLIRYAYSSKGGEQQWLPWKAIVDEMGKILKMYHSTRKNDLYVTLFIERVLRPIAMEVQRNFLAKETEFSRERIIGRLNWNSARWESKTALNVAVSLLDLYCRLGLGCSSLSSLFEREVLHRCDANAKASECVKGIVYCQGIKELGNVAFQKVSNLLMNEDDADERRRLCRGLGCVQNTELLKRKLLEVLDKKAYNEKEVAEVLESVANNPSDKNLLRICIERWKRIQDRFTNRDLLSDKIESCISKVHTREELLMIESAHKSCCNGRNIDIVQAKLEYAEFRMKWIEKYSETVSNLAQAELKRLRKSDPVQEDDLMKNRVIDDYLDMEI